VPDKLIVFDRPQIRSKMPLGKRPTSIKSHNFFRYGDFHFSDDDWHTFLGILTFGIPPPTRFGGSKRGASQNDKRGQKGGKGQSHAKVTNPKMDADEIRH